MKKARRPGKGHPTPQDGICVVRGCGDRYEGKAKKALHRCAHHRAELRGLQTQFKGSPWLRLMARAQRKSKTLTDATGHEAAKGRPPQQPSRPAAAAPAAPHPPPTTPTLTPHTSTPPTQPYPPSP